MKNEKPAKDKQQEEIKRLKARVAELEELEGRHERVEEELRQERDRTQRYLDVASVILLAIDKNEAVSLINRKGSEILGLGEKEILGKNWFETFIPEDVRPEARSVFRMIISGDLKPNEYVEFPVLCKNGERKNIAWYVSLLKDKNGQPAGTLSSGEDITFQKLAEKTIKDSEAKYRAFFESTGTAMAIVEEDTTISLINAEFEKFSGYTKNEIEGKISWTAIIHKDDLEKMKGFHAARRTDPGSAPRNYETHFVAKNGAVRDTFLTVTMIPGTKRSLVSLIDITERNSTSRALLESEERLKELWDNAPIAYHTLDSNGVITRVNQTESKLLGYKPEEMVGKHIFDFILPEQREKARERFQMKLTGRQFGKSENRVYIKKDGTKIYVSIDDALDRDIKGEVVGIRTTMVDMTERVKSEEDILEQKEFSAKLIQSSTTPAFVLDANHKVIIWNKACEKLTGSGDHGMVNTDLHWKAFYPQKRPLLADLIIDGKSGDADGYHMSYERSDVLAEGLHSEEWFKNLGGRERYIVFDAAPVYNTRGELIASIETMKDITEHKKAEEELEKSFKKLQITLEETVNALASTAEKRDSYTAGHQHRVMLLACAIAREMKLPQDKIDGIRVSATLHDIGKIYVPAEILNKPGKLMDLEMGLIKIHPKVGYDILKTIPFTWPVAQIVLQHHERIDGTGYPLGLSGDDILLEARIIGVADVVEAMAFHRPYRANLGMEKAIEEITARRGSYYDTLVVDACLKVLAGGNFNFE
ncbi:MAG TPA: hypothetical protein DEE98_02370 [Elusimicrobia bacterium]|nr:MAG: hypothetical protein A2278_00020 [Elusimicrobia bacterium RIFOXYA12_FULL_49_49]OGS09930.1 MAG: hypothetical protein A2386_07325 [Elusimicrobia bacterium RIFOXYB1_FULL_48_9]OGS15824.1 MAG: hypothetical protein A2251_04155 [Elusimicrobia bacterium RIFOXYA2_FULL_47_53]OGS31156.1 MAG: hypothetical protein A2323_08875 [Elusimicrobia bacterium RIFOXYB2_FULL_46_23]HBU69208.1 hypothetical protein [Elusimicrobiota bacterium]